MQLLSRRLTWQLLTIMILGLFGVENIMADIHLQTTTTASPFTLTLDDNFSQLSIGPNVAYYKNGKHAVGLEALIKKQIDWQYTQEDVPNFGFTQSVHWIKIPVINQLNTPRTLLLELAYPSIDSAMLFLVRNKELISTEHLGDHFSFGERKVEHQHLVYTINLLADDKADLYMRIETTGASQLPITFWSTNAFRDHKAPLIFSQGIYFGIIFAVIIYFIFIGTHLRETTYILFAISATSYALFQATLQGLGFQYLWPTHPGWNENMLVASLSISAFSIAIFTNNFLSLKKHQPLTYRILVTLAWFGIVIWIIAPVAPFYILIQLLSALSIPITIVAFAASISMQQSSRTYIHYFSVAQGCFMLATIMLALNKFGILPRNFYTEYAAQIGHTAQVIFLSLAISIRILSEKRQRLFRQQAATKIERTARVEQERLLELLINSEKEGFEAREKIIATQAEANNLKDEFLSTISHELRTPMNGVHGCLELMEQCPTNELQSYIATAKESAEQMMELIDSILDFAQVSSGDIKINKETLSLTQLVDEIFIKFEKDCEEKNISFITHKEIEPHHDWVNSDQKRLARLVEHLLTNSIKFTESGEITLLFITTTEKKSNKINLLVQITDTGLGIPTHLRESIFSAFKQGDGSINRKHGGLGIGLNICKKLAEHLGGSLELQSQESIGTTIAIKLTLDIATEEEVVQYKNQTKKLDRQDLANTLKTNTTSVLVVEDNQINQMVLQKQLLKLGYLVDVANDGSEALEYLKKTIVDVILMDCQMPIMDGYAATIAIRRLENDNRDIPIIAVTANVSDEDRERCFTSGMNDCLAKPVSGKQIDAAIVHWLEATRIAS